MRKKTFDAVAFMRKRREELSRAYAGLSAEQIKEQIHETLKDNPLWEQRPDEQPPSGGCPEYSWKNKRTGTLGKSTDVRNVIRYCEVGKKRVE